jgi:hypothetical protein
VIRRTELVQRGEFLGKLEALYGTGGGYNNIVE